MDSQVGLPPSWCPQLHSVLYYIDDIVWCRSSVYAVHLSPLLYKLVLTHRTLLCNGTCTPVSDDGPEL